MYCLLIIYLQTLNFTSQLPLHQMAAVQTSSYVTTPDASQNDLCVILMMTAVMAQMNPQVAHDQLAALMSLPATTNAVF